MKFLDVLKMANQNLWRNKVRAGLTILAIFIGSFTIILNTGINYGVNKYVDNQLAQAGGDGYLEVMRAGIMDNVQINLGSSAEVVEWDPNKESDLTTMMITPEQVEEIAAVDGVTAVRPWQMVSVTYVESLENDKKFELQVAGWPSDNVNIDLAAGRMVNNASDELEIALLPGFAAAMGYDSDEALVGQKVRLGVELTSLNPNAATEIREVTATVVGVSNKSLVSMGRAFINEALTNEIRRVSLTNIPLQYQSNDVFMVVAEFDPNISEDELQRIKDDLASLGFQAMTIRDQVGMMMTFFDAITMVLMIFGGIALLAASIGIVNTLFMAVQERTREIGLMKAMGLSSGKIFLMFSTEAILLGFWGSVVGIALAFVARAVGNHLAAQTFLSGLPGFTLIEFNAPALLVVTAVIMTIAFIAGTAPARRAAKQNPIDALRYE
jgi:putative ABC transport system permease protein